MNRTAWGLGTDPADDWRARARCRPGRHNDPDLFYPPGRDGASYRQMQEAKRFCVPCPARLACLAWALTHDGGQHGVWGATSPAEREQILRGGTDPDTARRCRNGHDRNEANMRLDSAGQPYCVPCRATNGQTSQQRMAARREAVMAA